MFGLDDAILAAGGASLIGGIMGADASKSAGNVQSSASNRAIDSQMQMFNTINSQQSPYRQAGSNALNLLSGYSGVPGYSTDPNASWNYRGQTFGSKDAIRQALSGDYQSQTGRSPDATVQSEIDRNVGMATPIEQSGSNLTGSLLHQFNADDLKTNLAPNYEFMKQQGLGAATNAMNLTGGLGGNTFKGVTDYATNYAGNAYQNAFSNYNTNQTNIFNRLSAIAGLGQNANAQTASAGVPIAGAVGNAQMAGGAAQASGIVGSTNAISGGINNAASWYALPSILNMGRSQAPS